MAILDDIHIERHAVLFPKAYMEWAPGDETVTLHFSVMLFPPRDGDPEEFWHGLRDLIVEYAQGFKSAGLPEGVTGLEPMLGGDRKPK